MGCVSESLSQQCANRLQEAGVEPRPRPHDQKWLGFCLNFPPEVWFRFERLRNLLAFQSDADRERSGGAE